MMKKRERIVVIAGAVLLVAGVVAGRERPTLELIETRAPSVAAVAADDGIDLTKLERNVGSLPQTDPFKTIQIQATAPAAAAVAAKPVAPPLPFRYFGKLTENGKREVFVMRGDDLLSIQAGKTYGEYRVDQVADARITFTYLPLKTKQTLDLQ